MLEILPFLNKQLLFNILNYNFYDKLTKICLYLTINYHKTMIHKLCKDGSFLKLLINHKIIFKI